MLGKPVIHGLRFTVEQIVKALSNGVPTEDLLQDYPELEIEDIGAVIAYAANSIENRNLDVL